MHPRSCTAMARCLVHTSPESASTTRDEKLQRAAPRARSRATYDPRRTRACLLVKANEAMGGANTKLTPCLSRHEHSCVCRPDMGLRLEPHHSHWNMFTEVKREAGVYTPVPAHASNRWPHPHPPTHAHNTRAGTPPHAATRGRRFPQLWVQTRPALATASNKRGHKPRMKRRAANGGGGWEIEAAPCTRPASAASIDRVGWVESGEGGLGPSDYNTHVWMCQHRVGRERDSCGAC